MLQMVEDSFKNKCNIFSTNNLSHNEGKYFVLYAVNVIYKYYMRFSFSNAESIQNLKY